MLARLTFLGITAFWVAMNIGLWRLEFGARQNEMPVPLELVWKKILTAPDASSLSVYQNDVRMGYCEFSTDVGQAMAKFDADKPPQEGAFTNTGGQVHLAGNVALGDFTNRLKFDGRVQFNAAHAWQELNLKITWQRATIVLHSLATNQNLQLTITDEAGARLDRTLTFDDLKNPAALLHVFAGNLVDGLLGEMALPALTAPPTPPQWTARRTRLKMGAESMPIYQLETRVLDRSITIDVSTLGEILRVDLPGHITARIDALGHP